MTYRDKVLDILRTAFGDNDTVNDIWHKLNGLIDSERTEANNVGYDDGYDAGRSDGYEEGKEEGLNEGKRLGFDEGVDTASQRIKEMGFGLDYIQRERISRIARGIY